MAVESILTLSDKFINGLHFTYIDDTTFSITAGQMKSLDNNQYVTYGSAITVDTAIVGANGIDTGVLEASKCYAIHAIYDELGYATPAILLSLSFTAPVLPTGYNKFRRISFANTDASVHFYQARSTGEGRNRMMFFDNSIEVLSSGAALTFTDISLAAVCPPIEGLKVDLYTEFTAGTPGDYYSFLPGSSTETAGIQITSANVYVPMIEGISSSVPAVKYLVQSGTDSLGVNISAVYDVV